MLLIFNLIFNCSFWNKRFFILSYLQRELNRYKNLATDTEKLLFVRKCKYKATRLMNYPWIKDFMIYVLWIRFPIFNQVFLYHRLLKIQRWSKICSTNHAVTNQPCHDCSSCSLLDIHFPLFSLPSICAARERISIWWRAYGLCFAHLLSSVSVHIQCASLILYKNGDDLKRFVHCSTSRWGAHIVFC